MTTGIKKEEFIKILNGTRDCLLSIKGGLKQIKSGLEFEALLCDVMKEVCAGMNIRGVIRTEKQSFPDIVIRPYGVEAKTTISDSWVSTGNSIVETTRVTGLKEIYVFFLKQGKKAPSDIRFKPYEECLSDIVVTHSPRYKINMELNSGETIFEKMGIDYDTFNTSDSIQLTKEYYRSALKEGEELWWIDQQDDVGITPIIKNFGDLDREIQELFKIESMVYFPKIFSTYNRKYIKPALHLLQKYQVTCSSLRDLFSAGGQKTITVKSKNIEIPKIYYNLFLNAKKIRALLNDADGAEMSRIWNIRFPKKQKVEELWLTLLDKYSALKQVKASVVYKEGLRVP